MCLLNSNYSPASASGALGVIIVFYHAHPSVILHELWI